MIYKDLDTGEVFTAKHHNIPSKGIFGKDFQALASVLHFDCRVPYERIASFFTNVFDTSMTPPTAMELCNRASDAISHKYDLLQKKIRKSDAVNADETGSNQNGIREWLWGFFTSTIAFFVFFDKRGGDILDRVLGRKYTGIIGCDGWPTYKTFSEKHGLPLQRCWAHLIREVKFICKDVQNLNDAYIWILDIFENVKKARKIKSKKLRQRKYDMLLAELDRWIGVYSSRKPMRKLVTLVKNGREHWFTCVPHLEIEPTNNSAERGLRHFVVLEKIMGCLRSETGKKTAQVMLSLIGTWKLQGLNPYKELKTVL
jgi:hypothetical protein